MSYLSAVAVPAAGKSMNKSTSAGSQQWAAVVLWDSIYFTMKYRVDQNILVLKRKSQRIDSLPEYQRECSHLMKLMQENADVRGIVIDMREARPRQDQVYEAATRGVSDLTFATYRKVAMLFRSVAGALQMRRFAGDKGDQLLTTTVEDEAVAFASRRT
jgi:hypothetical protein